MFSYHKGDSVLGCDKVIFLELTGITAGIPVRYGIPFAYGLLYCVLMIVQ